MVNRSLRHTALMTVAALLLTCGCSGKRPDSWAKQGPAGSRERELAQIRALPPELRNRIQWEDSRPRDFFRVIEQPHYVNVQKAERAMCDEERVLGLSVGGVHRAFPLNYLNDHELVQDEIGGTPVLVTW